MPLYARLWDDHYPQDERSPSADHFVVLSGSLEAGSFHRIANGPSEGRWSWGAGLGAAAANFVATGYTTSPDECRTDIGRSFRAMLARADLRERPDAKPDRRAARRRTRSPNFRRRPYDRETARWLGWFAANGAFSSAPVS